MRYLVLLLALSLAMPAAAGSTRVHASASTALATSACIQVGGITSAESLAVDVRPNERLWRVDTKLTSIVTATTVDVGLFRDSACEVSMTGISTETFVNVDADAVASTSTSIDTKYAHTDDTVDGSVYVWLKLDAGTATAVVTVTGERE